MSLLDCLNTYKRKNFLLSDVDFSLITCITGDHEKSFSIRDKFIHNPDPRGVGKIVLTRTELKEEKLVFDIFLRGTIEPIRITCINSNEIDENEISSYIPRTTTSDIEKLYERPELKQFIAKFSKNKVDHVVQYFGYLLNAKIIQPCWKCVKA